MALKQWCSLAALAVVLCQVSVSGQAYFVQFWYPEWVNPYLDDGNHIVPVSVFYPIPYADILPYENDTTTTPPTKQQTAKYPLLVFAHCLFGHERWYDYIWRNLASMGYIVAFFRSFENWHVSDEVAYAYDTRFLLDEIYRQNNNASAPIYQLLSDFKAVSGHSEGGGAAFIAASDYTGWSPGVTWEQSFDAMIPLSGCGSKLAITKEELLNIRIPSVIMSGTLDCMCNPMETAYYYYDMIPGCKYMASVMNATHCNYGGFPVEVDENFCQLAEWRSCYNRSDWMNSQYHLAPVYQNSIAIQYMDELFKAVIHKKANPGDDGWNANLNAKFKKDIDDGVIGVGWSNC